jgi:DNA-binding transcriptional LysR family regulator
MIDRREARLLEALAEELHFGRAAERLGMAQPHLSAALKRLEAGLGLRLFQRRPRVQVTPAGETVLKAVRRVRQEMSAALRNARAQQAGEVETLVVGFASSLMLSDIPRAFAEFRRAFPHVELQLREMHSAEQAPALDSGLIDLGFSREVREGGEFEALPVLRDYFVAALPSGHALAASPQVRLRDLATEPFVLPPREVAPTLHDHITALCAAEGVAPQVAQEADEWLTVLGFVRLGFGVSLPPALFSRLQWEGVVFRGLSGAPGFTSLFLCRPRGRANAAADALVEIVRRVAEEVEGI